MNNFKDWQMDILKNEWFQRMMKRHLEVWLWTVSVVILSAVSEFQQWWYEGNPKVSVMTIWGQSQSFSDDDMKALPKFQWWRCEGTDKYVDIVLCHVAAMTSLKHLCKRPQHPLFCWYHTCLDETSSILSTPSPVCPYVSLSDCSTATILMHQNTSGHLSGKLECILALRY